MGRMTVRAGAVATAFLVLVVAANWMTAHLGGPDHLWPVGFGMLATAGTFAAGLVLLARDGVDEVWGRWGVLGCIVAGALLSWWLSTPTLALASGIAFTLAELSDWMVYSPLRERGWGKAAIASNIVGAIVDTTVFLRLAGFPLWPALAGQLWVKIGITTLTVGAVIATRALLRHRLRPASA